MAGVTSVEFRKPEYEDSSYIGVVAHGSIRNGTSSAIGFYDRDTPDLEGLDARGGTVFFEQFGDYAYLPQAGLPRPSTLTLESGQSMDYSIPIEYANVESLKETRSWYTAIDKYSFHVEFANPSVPSGCDNPLVFANINGQSIPNRFKASD